jgi:hypothetical protein
MVQRRRSIRSLDDCITDCQASALMQEIFEPVGPAWPDRVEDQGPSTIELSTA